ncbi:MAG: TolC family protein, partial [Bacteroidales bacterium]
PDKEQELMSAGDLTTDSLSNTPLLNLYRKQVDVSEAQWKTEKANLLPKLNLSYSNQAVDGKSGFNAWEAGISVPLVFFSQSGKNKAARINYEINGLEYQQKELEINSAYRQLASRYAAIVDVLNYYKADALPLADEQINAANLGYRLGSLDYVQFIQNMETAINTRKDYLSRLAEYYEIKEQMEYLLGQ